jgi:NTP pyrophosphatase (non-canonical NTP hydrolase)
MSYTIPPDHHSSGGEPRENQIPRVTFKLLRRLNVARAERWHAGDDGMAGWSPAEWGNALAGETGELCNVLKKILRADHGLNQTNPVPRETLMSQASDEIADVLIYLDLVAARLGLSMEECLIRKFNTTSEKMGFPEKL